MKIAIPVNGRDIDSGVCMSFGRAPFFLIYDTTDSTEDYIVNKAAESQGGAGIKAAQDVADSGSEILLAPRCGENAAQVLKASGLKIYKTEGDSIRSNIDKFTEGKLSVLGEVHPGFHGHGG